jgi:O-antigen ligase
VRSRERAARQLLDKFDTCEFVPAKLGATVGVKAEEVSPQNLHRQVTFPSCRTMEGAILVTSSSRLSGNRGQFDLEIRSEDTDGRGKGDFWGAWCGFVLVAALVLTLALSWLAPRGLPVLYAFAGLLSVPALRLRRQDRPFATLLLLALGWAAVSTIWSPYHPTKFSSNTVLKLTIMAPLFWSLVCGARRASARLQHFALSAFAVGSCLLGVVLFADFALDAKIYEFLHVAVYKPIRHDLAEVAVAHSCFILALVWPLAGAAAVRTNITPWIVAPMIAGTICAAGRFGAEAPILSLLFVTIAGLATLKWPRWAPSWLAASAAFYFLSAPAVIWSVRASGQYSSIQLMIEKSWSLRMGYWSHALDGIEQHPLRGWGLDASRIFPGIVLHPHDTALQIWLELGGCGALLAATFWWLSITRLARVRADVATIALVASTTVYLLFGALNFGVWQEWWLALGALVALVGALLTAGAPSLSESTNGQAAPSSRG